MAEGPLGRVPPLLARLLVGGAEVYAFPDAGGDPEAEYLSDGISESLINSLSRLPELKVIARSSSFKYKGREIDPQEVARSLGVQAVVSGRVVQVGDNLQVSVELVNAQDRMQLWGEQYKRKTSDLLAVQAEISREIADGLRLRLTSGERQQLAGREPANPQAYELLLKGHYYRGRGVPGSARKAVEYYERAVAADPSYAAAYAALAGAYEGLLGSSEVNPKEYTPKAREAALRALQLDDSLAEAHHVMAFIHRDAWEWEAAEREYKRALELNPNFSGGHLGYAHHLNCMGRHEEAIPEAMRARELSPLDLPANTFVGNQFTFARRYDEALETLRKTLELEPRFTPAKSFLAYAYAAKGIYREAIAAYEETVEEGDTGTSTQVYLGAAYAGAGEHEKAREILKQLETTKEYVSPAELAVLYASLGEREKAFASLERAFAQHDLQLQYLKVEPGYDPLRSGPRFADLTRRVGLVDN